MKITGKTRIMFILADPVAHVIGSDVLNRSFAARGLDVAVSPLHVPPSTLAATVAAIRQMQNVVGFGCTIPHKAAVLALLDELTPEARAVGAVNFVRRMPDGRLTGHNVDGAGFMAGLHQHGIDVAGARVLMVGAGGVGKAIAFSLAWGGAAALVIANRDPAKAEALAAAVAASAPDCRCLGVALAQMPAPESFDLVINATSSGMKETDPLPFDPDRLSANTSLAEVIMQPSQTRLMQQAALRGCKTVPGLAMMEPQAELVAAFLAL